MLLDARQRLYARRLMGPAPLRRRVLLAEDDRDVRRLIAVALHQDGYDVTELSDGLQLFNCLGSCLFEGAAQPDLIISDLRMPSFTGLEVLGSAHRVDLGVPFILISGFSDRFTREEARSLGAAAIFRKPFDVEQLLSKVVELIPPS
jgi:CheY-like chemotaxis protein